MIRSHRGGRPGTVPAAPPIRATRRSAAPAARRRRFSGPGTRSASNRSGSASPSCARDRRCRRCLADRFPCAASGTTARPWARRIRGPANPPTRARWNAVRRRRPPGPRAVRNRHPAIARARLSCGRFLRSIPLPRAASADRTPETRDRHRPACPGNPTAAPAPDGRRARGRGNRRSVVRVHRWCRKDDRPGAAAACRNVRAVRSRPGSRASRDAPCRPGNRAGSPRAFPAPSPARRARQQQAQHHPGRAATDDAATRGRVHGGPPPVIEAAHDAAPMSRRQRLRATRTSRCGNFSSDPRQGIRVVDAPPPDMGFPRRTRATAVRHGIRSGHVDRPAQRMRNCGLTPAGALSSSARSFALWAWHDTPTEEEMSMRIRALLISLALLFAGLGLAPAASARVAVGIGVTVGTPPPAAIVEPVPPPRVGWVWVPGHWAWNGYRYVWRRGHWIAARPGWRYVPGYWVQSGPVWQFHLGYWTRIR